MDRRNITSVILCTTTMVHSLLIVAVQQHRYITTFTWFGLDRKLEGGWFSLNFKASEWLRKTAKCFSIWYGLNMIALKEKMHLHFCVHLSPYTGLRK